MGALLLQKLRYAQLIKKFHAFNGTSRSISMFMKVDNRVQDGGSRFLRNIGSSPTKPAASKSR